MAEVDDGGSVGPGDEREFDAAVLGVRDALSEHARRVRRRTADDQPEVIESAAALAAAVERYCESEQALTGAAAFWPADLEDADDLDLDELDEGDELEGPVDMVGADERSDAAVSVVLRLDFALADRDALLGAGERAAAEIGETDDPAASDDPVAAAILALAHRHGWDALAADEGPGLDVRQLTAQVLTGPAAD